MRGSGAVRRSAAALAAANFYSETYKRAIEAAWDTHANDGEGGWEFDVDKLTGFQSLDVPKAFLQEFDSTVQSRLWREASQHFDGEGSQLGVCNMSYRTLLQQLRDGPNGAKLFGIMLAAAAGAAWPRTRRSERARSQVRPRRCT